MATQQIMRRQSACHRAARLDKLQESYLKFRLKVRGFVSKGVIIGPKKETSVATTLSWPTARPAQTCQVSIAKCLSRAAFVSVVVFERSLSAGHGTPVVFHSSRSPGHKKRTRAPCGRRRQGCGAWPTPCTPGMLTQGWPASASSSTPSPDPTAMRRVQHPRPPGPAEFQTGTRHKPTSTSLAHFLHLPREQVAPTQRHPCALRIRA